MVIDLPLLKPELLAIARKPNRIEVGVVDRLSDRLELACVIAAQYIARRGDVGIFAPATLTDKVKFRIEEILAKLVNRLEEYIAPKLENIGSRFRRPESTISQEITNERKIEKDKITFERKIEKAKQGEFLVFKNQSRCDIWKLEHPYAGLGHNYDKVIILSDGIDDKHMAYLWDRIIGWTLVDKKGSALVLVER